MSFEIFIHYFREPKNQYDILGTYLSIHLRGPAFIQEPTFNREKTVIVLKENVKHEQQKNNETEKEIKINGFSSFTSSVMPDHLP